MKRQEKQNKKVGRQEEEEEEDGFTVCVRMSVTIIRNKEGRIKVEAEHIKGDGK